ncbi:pyruvate kinase [Limnochorda pilosa]|uniref:Pyruvate kinase n=1 Tax=Limnochorda pilosa TaxID=1555112 RepID=A0A0K2SKC8_LIMPI|nr:pyruvate kinase [Limnochorda pilosa]BAS27289.1 pyruvate kinase [Limnochorda pilosa]
MDQPHGAPVQALKRTKIICTIGPATESVDTLRAMVAAGMDLVRLNFSHGTLDEHRRRIEAVRRLQAEGAGLAILQDIQGPKIRLGEVPGGRVTLERGQEVEVSATLPPRAAPLRLSIPYPPLAEQLGPGSTLFLDDGEVELRVEAVEGEALRCRVQVGGDLSSHKGVTLPGVRVGLPPITPQDEAHIRFGVEMGVDWVAASFVRAAEHVEAVRDAIRRAGGDQPVVAKVENRQGLEAIDEIIEAADAVMVARGDLGVEIPPEEVPMAQKMIIQKCNAAGKPVITATQMLDSMARNPRPTRAEVTDVANAILDGSDAVMLSGETAVGRYPVESVRMMAAICRRTEASINYAALLRERRPRDGTSVAEAIAHATCQTAQTLGARAIVTSTQSGATARMVSRFRPESPIVAITPSSGVRRRLNLVWGVVPLLVPRAESIDQMIDLGVAAARHQGLVSQGDVLVIAAGVKTGTPGSTNLLQVHMVGEASRKG